MKKRNFLVFLVVFFCLVSFPIQTKAAEKTWSENLYFNVENFSWQEFASGKKLLAESGPIFGVGSFRNFDISKEIYLKGIIELFAGSIQYDGATWGGDPVKTTTDYLGAKIEGDFRYKLIANKESSLEPFAGIGLKNWLRNLQSTANAHGYKENWTSFYARLGIYGQQKFSDNLTAFIDGALNLPLYNQNRINEFGVTLNPLIYPGGSAELGLSIYRLKASFFYEKIKYLTSPIVYVYDGEEIYSVYQPESENEIFGLKLNFVL
jgi:hypothetical protein